MKSIKANITAVSGWVPEDKLTNQDFESMVDTTDAWILERTGIKERRILKGNKVGSSFLGAKAVERLLEKADLPVGDIDAIICATITPDMMFPNTANLICDQIGAKNIPAFDILAACSGFLYALEVGRNFIQSGRYQKVVVVGADKMSAITNYKDRSHCILFGDAAGAVLLEPSNEELGIMDLIIESDPVGKDFIYLKGGGSANPASFDTVLNGDHYFRQEGKVVYKQAVAKMAKVTQEIMARNQLQVSELDYFIPHQANQRIIEAVARIAEVPLEKVTINIDRYGNTTAATIPLCLWEWEKDFKQGDHIVMASFGAGFTWGACYLKWGIPAA